MGNLLASTTKAILRDRADSSGLSGWSCVPAVEDVAFAHDEALSLGAPLLKPADDFESADLESQEHLTSDAPDANVGP